MIEMMTCAMTVSMFHSVQNMQWLRDSQIVQNQPTNSDGLSHFFISNVAIDASDAGSYYCKQEMTDGTISDPVSVGSLRVLGQFSSVILPASIVRALVHTAQYILHSVHVYVIGEEVSLTIHSQ